MSHIYTISTNGTTITLTLHRGHHFIAEVTARPETGMRDLVTTAAQWRKDHDATPEISGPQSLWDALPEPFWQTLDALIAPTPAVA